MDIHHVSKALEIAVENILETDLYYTLMYQNNVMISIFYMKQKLLRRKHERSIYECFCLLIEEINYSYLYREKGFS